MEGLIYILYILMGFSVPLWIGQRREIGNGWKKRGNYIFHRTTGRKRIATRHMPYVVSSLCVCVCVCVCGGGLTHVCVFVCARILARVC